jgi:hypothetical protein
VYALPQVDQQALRYVAAAVERVGLIGVCHIERVGLIGMCHIERVVLIHI